MVRALCGIAFSLLFTSLFVPATAFAKGPIAIKALPFTISVPGQYTLSQNIVMTTNADGITVNADNVTIDMAGYGITAFATSPGNTGINVGSHTGVKIRNGFITGFVYGIYSFGSQNLSVTNMDIFSNEYGIFGGYSCKCTNITDCTFRNNNSAGIVLNGIASRVTGCTVDLNGIGSILVDYGDVSGNVVYGNGYGIYIGYGTARNNYVTNNTNYGITANSANCLVEGNVCNGNTPDFSINAGATKGLNNPATP